MSAPAPAACPRCLAAVPPGARFCPQCGAPLQSEAAPAGTVPGAIGERRPVTVLFADLSGFTKLSSELDPEDVHRLLSRYFDLVDGLVAQCGGTIDKHIGDAVMGVFGAPIAYGNDTLRALRAAVNVHAAMQTLSMEFGRPLAAHVGVASGEVVAADTGSAVHRSYTVTGDAVNLAARLDELAGAGETVISDDVYRSCASFVDADRVGLMAIRGLAREVPVWKMRALRADATSEHSLIGREAEMRRFLALLDVADSRALGATLFVRADPGMGKTSLTREFLIRSRQRQFRVHAATVLDFGAAQGRDAIHLLFASLLAIAPEAGAEDLQQGLDRAVANGRVRADDKPFAADLLALPQSSPATYEAIDNAVRTEGKLRVLVHALARESEARTTVVLLEDLHWASAWVLACTRALANAARNMRVLLVCTSRREGDPLGQAPLDGVVECLELSPLAEQDALQLAKAFLSSNPDVARRCVERAQGNPLFLTQLLRSGADGAAIPGTIQAVVLSRLDRLPAADKAAAQAAAVIGQRFDIALLRQLLRDPAYEVDNLLSRDLVRAEHQDARQFMFVHALIRDGAYASLLHSTRRALHAAAAEWYAQRDAILHAEHLDRADDPRAAAAHLAAARAEAAASRFDSAMRLLRRGSELPAAPGLRFELASFEGDLARDSGDVPASLAAFERALGFVADDAQRCNALLGIAAAHRATGAADAGLAALESVEPLAVSAGLAREASRAAYLRGCLEFARGDARASEDAQQRALEWARRANDPQCEAQALSGLADVLFFDGRMQSAYTAFARCVALCDRHGLVRFSLNNRCMLAIVHAFLEPADAALPELERARGMARELHHPAAEVMADESECWVRVVQGRDADAIAPGERSLALARQIGSRRFEAFDAGLLAFAYWRTGRRVDAVNALRDADVLVEEVGLRFIGAMMQGARVLMNEDPTALPALLAVGEQLLLVGCPMHCHFWFRQMTIEAALSRGDWDGALREAAALESVTSAEPVPWADFQVARARALVAAGRNHADRSALAACRARAVAMHLPGALAALDAALARVHAS